MQLHDSILALIAFLSEVLGTLSGFGSSTFFVPSALFFESFRLVLALTAILHCFGNIFKIIIFRKNFDWKIFLLLFLPVLLFTGIGAVLATKFSGDRIQQTLGGFLIIFSLFSLFGVKRIKKPRRWVVVLLSSISGLSTGLIGTGGAIRGIALSALHLPKESFVVISSAIDLGGDLLRTAIYLKNSFMDWNQAFYIPLLAVAAYAGARTGQFLLRKINQHQFEKIVSVFVLISGLLMLF